MKLKKGLNGKRVVLLSIALGLFLLVLLFSLLIFVGMSLGYNAAIIENNVKKSCNCKNVLYIKPKPNEETFLEDFKSGDLSKNFSIKLIDCDYNNLEDLKEDVLAILIKKELCEQRNIQFIIENFKGQDKQFKIINCNINNN